jgi:hypothetical protein
MTFNREPVLWTVAGGTSVLQAAFWVLIEFGVEITPGQQAALTAFASAALAFWARSQVTPMASLPPGVAGEIADAKSARAAERAI